MKIQRYVIAGRSEECDCPWCGCPSYTGEKAWSLGDDRAGFCSRACAAGELEARLAECDLDPEDARPSFRPTTMNQLPARFVPSPDTWDPAANFE